MIHKTSIVDKKAKVHSSVSVGPFSVIGPNVEIGENVVIHSHVNITGNTRIGCGNKFYPFASIGNDPQDLKYNGEDTKLIIGNNNKFREYVTVNPGTVGGGGLTKIGDNCLFMISSHVAHDCVVGNNVMIGGQAGISGHLKIGNNVQIGGGSGVIKDIPDNTKVMGYPAKNLKDFLRENK